VIRALSLALLGLVLLGTACNQRADHADESIPCMLRLAPQVRVDDRAALERALNPLPACAGGTVMLSAEFLPPSLDPEGFPGSSGWALQYDARLLDAAGAEIGTKRGVLRTGEQDAEALRGALLYDLIGRARRITILLRVYGALVLMTAAALNVRALLDLRLGRGADVQWHRQRALRSLVVFGVLGAQTTVALAAAGNAAGTALEALRAHIIVGVAVMLAGAVVPMIALAVLSRRARAYAKERAGGAP
jgi:hypothetical protein